MMQRITYDGMEWPLETFLDAYGFTTLGAPHAASARERFALDLPLEVVMPDGPALTVRQMCGRHVDWHEAIAVKGAEGLNMCVGCGLPFEPWPAIYASDVATRRRYVVNQAELDFCEDCLMDEWQY